MTDAAGALTLEQLPAAAFVLGDDGVIRASNARCRELFRAPVDALAAIPVTTLFPEEDEIASRLSVACADGEPVRLRASRLNGVTFTVDAELSRDAHGMLCLLRELRSDHLLSESQLYLDVAFENAPIGMALFNTDGEYVRVNDALCTILGRTRQGLRGRRDLAFTH